MKVEKRKMTVRFWERRFSGGLFRPALIVHECGLCHALLANEQACERHAAWHSDVLMVPKDLAPSQRDSQ